MTTNQRATEHPKLYEGKLAVLTEEQRDRIDEFLVNNPEVDLGKHKLFKEFGRTSGIRWDLVHLYKATLFAEQWLSENPIDTGDSDEPQCNYHYVFYVKQSASRLSFRDVDDKWFDYFCQIIERGIYKQFVLYGEVYTHNSLLDFVEAKAGLDVANPEALYRSIEGCARVSTFEHAKRLLKLCDQNGYYYPPVDASVEIDRDNHRPSEVTTDQAEQIQQLDQQGMTQREIASQVNLSQPTVYRVIHNCYHDNTYESKPKSDSAKRPSGRGTSNDYQFARLKRDNPELAQQVLTKKMSVYKASVESGARRRVLFNLQVTEATSMAKVSKKICDSLPPDKLAELAALLTELASNKQQTSSKQSTVDITN